MERGVHSRDLYRWRDDGDVIELSRGVFRRADAPAASRPDELAVARRAPHAIVCCLNAAAIHDLTDEIPRAVQIAVALGSTPPRIDYPPVQIFRFRPATFELGLSSFQAAPGESVRIYDQARTVVDLIRLRHRFGEPIAYTALNRYLTKPDAQRRPLLIYASQLGAERAVRGALDVIVST
jgi:hypothetical protein